MNRATQLLSAFASFASLTIAAAIVVPLASSPADAATSYPNLCDSTRGVCGIVPFADAPRLDQNVCWDGRTARLKGTSTCAVGRPYAVSFGYVSDPLTNTVTALAPVIDTCDAGYCVADQIQAGATYEDGIACCSPTTGDCSPPDENGVCQFGDITWCKTLEDNGDGTVTCHE